MWYVNLIIPNRYLLAIASVSIVILLLTTYARRLLHAIQPTSLFTVWKAAVSRLRDHFVTMRKLDDEIKSLPVAQLNANQLQKWESTLAMNVLYNRAFLLIAEKLREYQHSGIPAISAMLTILSLMIITTLAFSMINLALYKIDPSSFDTSGSVTFWTFIYYSFNAIIFGSIKELTPVTTVTQLSSIGEKFFAFLLITIFVTLMFTVRNQRHSHELDGVIGDLESEGQKFEGFIRSTYRIDTIEEAIAELEKVKSSMLKIILFFSRNL